MGCRLDGSIQPRAGPDVTREMGETGEMGENAVKPGDAGDSRLARPATPPRLGRSAIPQLRGSPVPRHRPAAMPLLPHRAWFSTAEVAAAIGMSPSFVRDRIERGELPARAWISGRRVVYRVRRVDLEAWIARSSGEAFDRRLDR